MGKTYVISDIHGCAKTFIALVENVIQLKKQDVLFLLGDYIDRGPDSRGVIDYIICLQQNGFNVVALRGNHEQMLLDSINDPSTSNRFLINGGQKTIESFGISETKDLSPHYIDFFNSLTYYALHKKFILVHAGLNFEIPDPFEDTTSMLWIRRFTVSDKFSNRIIVHGHTPTALVEIQDSIAQVQKVPVISIDNGCVYGLNEFYGNLCCLQLEPLELFLQPNIDIKPLF